MDNADNTHNVRKRTNRPRIAQQEANAPKPQHCKRAQSTTRPKEIHEEGAGYFVRLKRRRTEEVKANEQAGERLNHHQKPNKRAAFFLGTETAPKEQPERVKPQGGGGRVEATHNRKQTTRRPLCNAYTRQTNGRPLS